MKKIINHQMNECYYYLQLDNGLQVYLMPKKDFAKTYALFATKYGAIDNEFIPINSNEYIIAPFGVAHFLEHKMFEMPNGENADYYFAKIGAYLNAFTMYERTSYLFSTVSNVKEATKLLLDFVQTPFFTDETIENEKGIIEQEIKMYLDRPEIIMQIELLKAMYKQNFVREDVIGTLKSVKSINKDIIQICYDTFYHPNNMCLAIVGGFNYQEIEELIINNQKEKCYDNVSKPMRRYYIEDNQVCKPLVIKKMDVIIPKIVIGLKIFIKDTDIITLIKEELAISALLHQHFYETTSFHVKMKNNGIINNSFRYDVTVESTYAFISVSCDTMKSEEFINIFKEKILSIATEEINEKSLNQYISMIKAQTIRKYDSLEFLANALVDSCFEKISLFEYLDSINLITTKDVENARRHFIKKALTVVKILPK